MKNRLLPLCALAMATVFTYLFYDLKSGLNLAVFSTIFVSLLLYLTKSQNRKFVFWFFAANVVALSWAFAWHGNVFTWFAWMVNFIFLAGAVALMEINQSVPLIKEALLQFPVAQKRFVLQALPDELSGRVRLRFRHYVVYALPVVGLIALFVFFYSQSNPIFNGYVQQASLFFGDFFAELNLQMVLTFLMGLLLVNTFLFSVSRIPALHAWAGRSRYLTRFHGPVKRQGRQSHLHRKLVFEYKSAVFLIVVLNLLLLILNISDLQLVWFGFEWKGQLLKEFVHEGTGLLILSICISAFTILYFFRGNLHFYQQNRALKILVNIWLAQNMFLTLSVLMRNLRYIDYYGLAYLRIGVFFFLAAVAMLLIFVYLKVLRKESMLHFLHRNIITGTLLLAVCGMVDWSAVITRYNLANYKKSFVHMSYLVHMPDRCLPVLQEYASILPEIASAQKKKGFRYSERIDEGEIAPYLERRRNNFVAEYQGRKWQEQTLADWRAYRRLRGQ